LPVSQCAMRADVVDEERMVGVVVHRRWTNLTFSGPAALVGTLPPPAA
jgi:hypothetical protein